MNIHAARRPGESCAFRYFRSSQKREYTVNGNAARSQTTLRVSDCVTIANVATSGVAATRPVSRPTVAESQGENPKPIQPASARARGPMRPTLQPSAGADNSEWTCLRSRMARARPESRLDVTVAFHGDLRTLVQFDGDELGHPRLLHRDAIQPVGDLHRFPIVSHKHELGAILHTPQHGDEPPDVGIVQRCVDLIQ